MGDRIESTNRRSRSKGASARPASGPSPRPARGASVKALKSPRITALSWGSIQVDGRKKFRDAKLYPGGVREWDWEETGTAHTPGIQPADVEELIAHGATVVVLSQGMLSCLRVTMDTLDLLARKGVRTHVLKTEDAVRRYNELRETEAVGALIHTTC
jgi:hypothetical protein